MAPGDLTDLCAVGATAESLTYSAETDDSIWPPRHLKMTRETMLRQRQE
jgi:hypothetical protein